MRRSSFLEHVAWTGAGIAYTLGAGGLLIGRAVAAGETGPVDFVQISDSHIGFNKEANKDVVTTLEQAIGKINALERSHASVTF